MFEEHIIKYENELLNSVVPFWEKNSIDHEFGGYFTSLDRDGSVYDYTKYMWMQWRIIYMFCELFMSEYSKPAWLDIAAGGFDFLYKYGRNEDGHYYFALNRKGDPAIVPYSIFSDCFAAMGSAAMYKATQEERYRQAAEAAMSGYVSRLDAPKGKWEKSLGGQQHFLSLGHYMMLANLGVIMGDCLDTDCYRGELDHAVNTVLDKFWNPERRLMFENVLGDGSFDLDSCKGRMLNPGHVLEAMWFILNLSGKGEENGERVDLVCDVIKATLEHSWDKQYGGIYYFMDALNKPHLELQWDMKLWWPHCEALVACLYAFKITGDLEYLNWFIRIDEWVWNHFPDSDQGEWYGYLNRCGVPTHQLKGGKWKTFFHLPRFLLKSIVLMKEIDSTF